MIIDIRVQVARTLATVPPKREIPIVRAARIFCMHCSGISIKRLMRLLIPPAYGQRDDGIGRPL